MSLQQDVLDSIGPEGVAKEKLREKVGNIGQAELDCVLNALLRAQRVRLSFGRYEVVSSGRSLGSMPSTARPPDESKPASATQMSPPTAAEELAANIRPATRVCQDCKAEKELEKEFSRSNLGTGYLKTCKECIGKRVAAGTKKAQSNPPSPATTGTTIKVSAPIPAPPPPKLDQAAENAKAIRQAALNRIALLEVDLANQRSLVTRCDAYLKLHAEFAGGAA